MSGRLAVEGPLSFATFATHLKALDAGPVDTLDLARCPRIDSAGAAYLLESARRALARGVRLQVINANEQVRGLLHFFELEPLVGAA